MANKILRKLIDVEIRLGFIYIPSQNIELMPDINTKIEVNLDDKIEKVTYNPVHRRIFGLTSWYKKHNLKVGQEVIIIRENNIYKFELKNKKENEEIQEIIDDLIDISGLSSTAKGDIVEDRIKELILLHGQGLLSVYRPTTDSEGIDLIVVKNGMFQPIFLQVKSRFNLSGNSFITNINKKTFNVHHSYYVICAYFNLTKMELFNNVLLIPSSIIAEEAILLKNSKRPSYQIVASLAEGSKGKWSQYFINKSDLSNRLIEKFEEMAKYIK